MPVEVANMGEGVNGPHAEFAPIPFGKDKVIFGSIREDEVRYFHIDSLTTRRRLYTTERVAEIWLDAEPWDVPFNAGETHLVNGAFSSDGSTFAFTRCEENWKKEMECALWLVKKDGQEWGTPEKLNESINVPGAIVTQPTFALDPRRGYDVLYYASNQPDGQGGMDIWFTYFDGRKEEWRDPRNLGRRVNTPQDEMTPYYQLKEKKLYYSSAGHPGMGGLDVFSARGEMRKFATPKNTGVPINSHADDFYYVLLDDRESGYLVSNRKGGYQMINETCCDDLYSFYIPDVIHLAMEGFVMQVKEEDYMSGKGDKLSANSFNANFLDGVTIELYLIEDSAEVLMQRSSTSGDGIYFVEFEPEKEYKVVLSRPGFFSNQVEVDTRGMAMSDTLVQNVGLSIKREGGILLDNILFEFDSSDLTEESKAQIDKGILPTLIENPELIVELGAHTDNKGSDSYNKRLSRERAESVVEYLKNRGIPAMRLRAKGYGADEPVEPNTKPDGSDNPEGRALNRRTEIKVVGELELPDEDDD
jgi:outer membrane protein OmpA-like peptidoglycan-associated protein